MTASAFDSPPTVPRSLPLERKLPLLIFGVLSLVLLLSVVVSYYEVRAAAEVSAGERLLSLSRVVSSMAAEPLGARIALMRRAATDSFVIKALRTPDRQRGPEASRALALLARGADSLTPAELWTVDGRPIGARQARSADGASALSGRGPHVTRDCPTRPTSESSSRKAGERFFWAAVPVRQGSDLVGYIAQVRRVGANARGVQAMRELIGSEIRFFIRNADGDAWVDATGEPVARPTTSRAFSTGLQLLTYRDDGTRCSRRRPRFREHRSRSRSSSQ